MTLLTIACNPHKPVETLGQVAAERGLELVLVDLDRRVADLYQAITTPHFYVIDAQGILRYQGAYDDVTFRQRTPTHCFVREAVKALSTGKDPEIPQSALYGCAIVRYS